MVVVSHKKARANVVARHLKCIGVNTINFLIVTRFFWCQKRYE